MAKEIPVIPEAVPGHMKVGKQLGLGVSMGRDNCCTEAEVDGRRTAIS